MHFRENFVKIEVDIESFKKDFNEVASSEKQIKI